MKTAIVKATGANQNPWQDGVRVTILGDPSDLINLQRELEEVKKLVNTDVNRAGMALKDVKVTIEFE